MESKATKDSLPPIPAKRYFTIGEVSELCGVKPHVLRYWEQEFTQLRPVKRRGNRRYYQHHEVLLIRRIRALRGSDAPCAARARYAGRQSRRSQAGTEKRHRAAALKARRIPSSADILFPRVGA